MTNKQAIDWINRLIQTMKSETTGEWPDPSYKDEAYIALEMAIKALEQEPCEDAINRQELIDGLLKKVKTQRSTIEIVDKLIPMIKDMPSVQPKSKTIINHGTMNITL